MTSTVPVSTAVNALPDRLPDDHPLVRRFTPSRRRRASGDSAASAYIPMDIHGLRVWLYGRVSDARQGKSKSDEEQIGLGRNIAQMLNCTITREFNCDPDWRKRDRSASRRAKARRLEWERLVAIIEAGAHAGKHADTCIDLPQMIIVWEVSRGGREAWKWTYFLDLCRAVGILIYVISARRAFNLDVPDDFKTLADLGNDAEHELEMLVGRVQRGLSERVDSGKPMGRVKYGWVRKYHPETREFVGQYECSESAVVVRLITRLTGRLRRSPSAVARYLTQRGYLTPNDLAYTRRTGSRPAVISEWTPAMVTRIATDIHNIGKKIVGDGETIEGQWPAIVDEPDYYAAVAQLDDPERKAKYGRKGKGRKSQPDRARHLLSWYPVCECGGLYRHRAATEAIPAKGKRRARSAYPASYQCLKCFRRVDAAALENHVVAYAVTYLARPEIYTRLTRNDDSALVQARADRDKLTQELNDLYGEVERGETSRKMARADEVRLEAGIKAAEERIAAASAPSVLQDVTKGGVRLADLERWFTSPGTPVATKRKGLMQLLAITVGPAPYRGAPVGERTTVVPLCLSGCGAPMVHAADGWTCTTCECAAAA